MHVKYGDNFMQKQKTKREFSIDRFQTAFTVDISFEECHDRLIHLGLAPATEAKYMLSKPVEEANNMHHIDDMMFSLNMNYSIVAANVVIHRLYGIDETQIEIRVNRLQIMGFCLVWFCVAGFLVLYRPWSPSGYLISAIILSIVLYFASYWDTVNAIKQVIMRLLADKNIKNTSPSESSLYHEFTLPLQEVVNKIKANQHIRACL